jgi:hypothetical protein
MYWALQSNGLPFHDAVQRVRYELILNKRLRTVTRKCLRRTV